MLNKVSFILGSVSLVIIISLGITVKYLYKELNIAESNLNLVINENKQLSVDLNNLQDRYKKEIEKVVESNKEILGLKSKLSEVLRYAENSKDSTVITFNNVIDRLWENNSSSNTNTSNNK
ncbi:hypothetical protein NON42_001162 [Campylobacter coli]|nr:hypothetical protein [Campylobacter coli]EJM4836578.1 hypothetical protein [Campylobacter coli]